MNIKLWSQDDSWLIDTNFDLKESDILDAWRYFYLFFSEDEIQRYKDNIPNDRGHYIYGKAIQVNLSIAKGGQENIDLSPWLRGSDNSTYMTISMYTYDTIFYENITNFAEAEFTLVNSMISSTTNDYNIKKSMINGHNVYSKDLRDKPEKRDQLIECFCVGSPNIPEPMYYTIKQQELAIGDIYCITSLFSAITHYGRELADENTHISVMNIFDMDTLEPMIRDKMYQVKNMQNSVIKKNITMFDALELSEHLLFNDFDSMQNGLTYIYDSQLGVNIIDYKKDKTTFMPFGKYQFKDKMIGDIERTKDIVNMYCKSIEKKFGSINLLFTPFYYGDKLDVYFKDYNKDNQPIIKKDSTTFNIDNENKIKDEISDAFKDLEEQYVQE